MPGANIPEHTADLYNLPTSENSRVKEVFSWVKENSLAITELQIELAEIGSPTGKEQARGDMVEKWFRSAGCTVSRDTVGNVLALRNGDEGKPAICVSAHLDNVFDSTQRVRIIRPGEKNPYANEQVVPAGEYHGPGIADDAAGLAAIIGIAQAMASSSLTTKKDILFLATVGEEGKGNLKGSRYFLSSPNGKEISSFITIDHGDPNVIVNRSIGSRRYSVKFSGPGGHSWNNYGRYNPAIAMALAARNIQGINLPKEARSSVNVGVMNSGTSVNAIPESAYMEVDLRSEVHSALTYLDREFHKAVENAQEEELKKRPHKNTKLDIFCIGERPAGETPKTDALVIAAQDALENEGFQPCFAASSTDANAAMAVKIPAICIGWGGRSGNQHSRYEYFAPAGRERTLAAILRMIIGLART